jgi:hypothetical protein
MYLLRAHSLPPRKYEGMNAPPSPVFLRERLLAISALCVQDGRFALGDRSPRSSRFVSTIFFQAVPYS